MTAAPIATRPMYRPMLAIPLEKAKIDKWEDWMIEVKYDGWRLLVDRKPEGVTAWTRPRVHAGANGGKTMLQKDLPLYLVAAIMALPVGVYDGELLAGTTSTDVNRKDKRGTDQRFVVFDVLEIHGNCVMAESYVARRRLLKDLQWTTVVSLAESQAVLRQSDVTSFVERVWRGGGEGAMLKRKAAPYREGKRSPDFVKVKKVMHEVMTVIGFEKGKGKKVDRGPFAMVRLRGAKGETSVKTVNDEELAAFERAWDQRSSVTTHADTYDKNHPAIGRKLMVEFNDWTPKDGYRHPRWDRWEDE